MAEKFLRGKQPLTMYRGSSGTNGGYLYRGGVIPVTEVDAKDAERLIGEGFLDLVVRKGESFILAEDTATGSAGDVVTTGDTGTVPDNEVPDLGTFNAGGQIKLEEQREAEEKARADAEKAKAVAEIEERREGAKAKLPADGSAPDGRASKDAFVEYLAARGYDYDELVKQDKADLVELAKK